jgi:hypothetical protein
MACRSIIHFVDVPFTVNFIPSTLSFKFKAAYLFCIRFDHFQHAKVAAVIQPLTHKRKRCPSLTNSPRDIASYPCFIPGVFPPPATRLVPQNRRDRQMRC